MPSPNYFLKLLFKISFSHYSFCVFLVLKGTINCFCLKTLNMNLFLQSFVL